jgi:hypothetical protein
MAPMVALSMPRREKSVFALSRMRALVSSAAFSRRGDA